MYNLQGLLFYLMILSVGAHFKAREAKEGEFPYVVAINGNFEVAGTLISLDKILTSAHRITNELRRWGHLTAVAGVTLTLSKQKEQYQMRNIIYFKPHSGYQWKAPYGVIHDIAVASLDQPFIRTPFVNVAPLISGDPDMFKTAWDELARAKTACQVVTWIGKQDDELEDSSTAKAMSVFGALPLEDEDCNKNLNDSYTPDFICARSTDLLHHIITLKIRSGIMICNGNVYAIYYLYHGSKHHVHMFLRLWRYLDYFNIGQESSLNTLQHLFPSNLFTSIAQYLSVMYG